jgi:xanthine dehydrogenase YagT iron-sulfur-binding subunit
MSSHTVPQFFTPNKITSKKGGGFFAGPRTVSVHTTINGSSVQVTLPAKYTLAELLREKLNLTGTKLGCNRAECGVCTVLVDGVPVFSCTVLAVDVNNKEVETVEGLASRSGLLHPLQQAFIKNDALQCGFCTPGLLMSLKALVEEREKVTLEEIKDAIAGNYCRCGTYPNVFRAVLEATTSSYKGLLNYREEK